MTTKARQRDTSRRCAALLVFLPLLLVIGVQAQEVGGAAAPPDELRILAYNVYNFMATAAPEQVKTPESRQTVVDIITRLDPHIAVLVETGGAEAVEELVSMLDKAGADFPFRTIVKGYDRRRRIALLSKFRPAEVCHDTTSTFNLKGRRLRVRRGFAHCVFRWANGYTLHVLGAHVKSKCFDPLGQTDIRRYEARLLRYHYNDLIKKDPKANVLILGDFNDTPDASPVSTVCSRRSKDIRQLYDLRPVDRYGMSWTYCWDKADSYTRIDYAFASYELLPEVDFAKTVIPWFPEWYIASDHRPLLVTLHPSDQPADATLLDRFERNHRKPDAPMASFHKGRVVGTRRVRR
ncbi:MAG: endonuclease/exonuclease/phosphatase family protein [Lentisphaeria bacterium]|nr:endonuclease/exonuclease/phosphatase family protein [Lentisphaeria bacterium]